ncbi:uncharacterized protein LOC113771667 [Coffea eugenioides]|uniref:uncharacterized protein LOC113771667 n=1 Tax=Coffea eugenioides TaxID=49369 RepID=UPI000F60AA36|nr:uncharacterized protein LOC113771667 [Coffea eugenioides]
MAVGGNVGGGWLWVKKNEGINFLTAVQMKLPLKKSSGEVVPNPSPRSKDGSKPSFTTPTPPASPWSGRSFLEALKKKPSKKDFYDDSEEEMEIAEESLKKEKDTRKEAEIAASKFPRVTIEKGKNPDFWKPWRKSLIIKVLGRTVNFRALEMKLRELWKLDQYFELIDLKNSCFITRFLNKEDYKKVLEEGPWMFQDNYVTISKWKPDFRPAQEDIKTTLAWAVKVDSQTLEVARRKYARICVEVDLKKPLIPFIWVNNDLQAVEYEELDAIYFDCGQYGHIAANCLKNSNNRGGKDAQVNPVAGKGHRTETRVAPEANPYGPWMLAK